MKCLERGPTGREVSDEEGRDWASSLHVAHINVQSLKNKVNELEAFLIGQVPLTEVLCITEHWLRSAQQVDSINLDCFSVASCFCRTQLRCGGSMIFVREGLNYVKLSHVDHLSVELHCEISAVRLVNLNVTVYCFYRSPNGNFGTFLDILEQVLEAKESKGNIIICGDFNVRFNLGDSHSALLCDLLNCHGYKRTIEGGTRYNNCLDNIFINFNHNSYRSGNLEALLSDHCCQVLDISVESRVPNQEMKICQPLTTIGKFHFFNRVANVDWGFIDDTSLDVHIKFSLFINMLADAVDSSFPIKRIVCKREHSPRVLWYNDSLREQRELLGLLYSAYKCNRTEANLATYKHYRNKYKRSIREAKVAANDSYISRSNVTSRAVWGLINAHRACSAGQKPVNIDPNELNSAFVGVADEVAGRLPQSDLDPLQFLNLPQIAGEFHFKEATFNDIRDIIYSLKKSNCADIYGFNITLLRKVSEIVLIPLTKLINQCVRVGIFPDSLKVASIIPIYKKGDRSDPLNYRPISILPIISKVIEKFLTIQIVEYFEMEHLLTSSQYGFRPGRSTQDAILDYVDQTLSCFENKRYSAAVFCDLTKAFDCVSHYILIEKLRAYGFGRPALDLMSSYLSGRSQMVKLKDCRSGMLPVLSGVPQGSVLGPVLFLAYINDMDRSLTDSHAILYADDTTLMISCDSPGDALDRGNELLSRAELWFTANKLALNRTKTSTLVSALGDMSGVGDNCPVKFLGVHLDSDLSWRSHGDNLANSLTSICYALRQLANRVSTAVLRTAYFALFHSRLSYALLAWGHSAIRHRVFGLQRRAIRIVGGVSYRSECRDLFRSLNILTLPSEYALQCIMHVKLHMDRYETHMFRHNHDTRYKDYLVKPFTRLSRGQTGTSFFGVELFNSLPCEIKSLPMKPFKRRIAAYLVRGAFYSFEEIASDLKPGSLNCSLSSVDVFDLVRPL